MNRYIWSKVPKWLAMSLIAVQLTALPLQAAAETPGISIRNAGSAIQTTVLKPAWTIPVDSTNKWETSTEQQAVAANGRIYTFAGKKLIAIDAATGKKLWQYGVNLNPKVTFAQGVLYGVAMNGAVYAVGENGSKKWNTPAQLENADKLTVIGDTLYVTRGVFLFAYEAATGKLRWKAGELNADGGAPEVMEAEGVVLRIYMVQGALTSAQLTAYDKKTGQRLWGNFRQYAPLKVQAGLVYSVEDEMLFMTEDGPDRRIKIAAINLRTGVTKGERTYKWTVPQSPDGTFSFGGMSGSAFLEGNDLYIYQGTIIAKYAFDSYSAAVEPKPVQKWNMPYSSANYAPLYKIYRERMFFQTFNGGYGLAAMKLANGQTIGWSGDNPAAQMDVHGNGVYIGQTDGVFYGMNFATMQPVFKVSTGSRVYGPTLIAGNTVVIQAEGRLIGVKLPAVLK